MISVSVVRVKNKSSETVLLLYVPDNAKHCYILNILCTHVLAFMHNN